MVLLMHYGPPPVEQPGELALDFPSAAVASECSSILWGVLGAVASSRADRSDAPLGPCLWQYVAVEGAIGNDPLGLEQAAVDGAPRKDLFIRSCAQGPCGERKAMRVCEDHDLGASTSLSRSNSKPPFLALEMVRSRKHSVMSIFPGSRRSKAGRNEALSRTPAFLPWMN